MEEFQKPPRVILDPGHGGGEIGARFMALREKDVVLDICRLIQGKLQYTYWTAMTRNADISIPIRSRAQVANKWGADMFLSIHTNADPDADEPGMPEARGEEIWIYPGSVGGLELATCLRTHVDKFFPDQKFRGIAESSKFGVLRLTNMPAALIEVGFLDNSRTNAMLSEHGTLKRIADLMTAGIREYIKGRTN